MCLSPPQPEDKSKACDFQGRLRRGQGRSGCRRGCRPAAGGQPDPKQADLSWGLLLIAAARCLAEMTVVEQRDEAP